MSLLIQKPGILTTVQDLGRRHHRRFGVNPTGAMDHAAARLSNIMLGNEERSPVIEIHFPAPEIAFETDCVVAIAGGDFMPVLNDAPVENWRSFVVEKESILRFTRKIAGNRSYLAVKGGLNIRPWLESSSTNLTAGVGGYHGRRLETGDRLGVKSPGADRRFSGRRIAASLIPLYRPFPTVRIIPGAEFESLGAENHELLENENFTVSNNSNRMGFRLTGSPIRHSPGSGMLSSAVDYGTIQLLPDGQLIVLMVDHQTTGGYPRIAHVISRDLPLIAQLGAGDKVAFHLVDLAHAEHLALEFELELNLLRVAAKLLL